MQPITVVLTSCGRFDLLERGLRSFFAHNTAPIARFLVMEDTGDATAAEIARAVDPGIEVHLAPQRRGQVRSIDYAYGTVDTPLIFHTEDDYIYLRSGFLEDAAQVLNDDDRISMVSIRRWHHGAVFPIAPTTRADIAVIEPPRSLDPGWFGYAFHAGLRRKREWQRFGPFTPFGREWDVSYAMKRAGLRMVYLANAGGVDIDEGVSVGAQDPARKRRGVGRRIYSLRKSAKKYLFYAERALGRYKD